MLSLKREIFLPEHQEYRQRFRKFIAKEILPNYQKWERKGKVDPECYRLASKEGFYCSFQIPVEFGGGGCDDFRYNAIVAEELEDMGAGSVFFTLGNDMVTSYFTKCCLESQRKRWLPLIAQQGKILAVAMSEPQAGSDLAGVQAEAYLSADKTYYVLNGRKMWISNAAICDYCVVACYTNKEKRYKGMSLLVVEKGMEGFSVEKRFGKLGKHCQDTCLISFTDVKVPVDNMVGREGDGFKFLMQSLPKERLSIAVTAMAGARRALDLALAYVKGREAFGSDLSHLQSVQFAIAEMRTEVEVATVFVDRCILELTQNNLTTQTASMAKMHATELSCKVIDRCLQFFGGYGYLKNSPIGKMWTDHRVLRIYGGSNEVMREIIAKGVGLKPQRFKKAKL